MWTEIILFGVVFAVGVALGLLARKGYISKEQVEAVKRRLMEIPKDALPEKYRLILEGAIIAMMIWTGEMGREEGEKKLAEINSRLLRMDVSPIAY